MERHPALESELQTAGAARSALSELIGDTPHFDVLHAGLLVGAFDRDDLDIESDLARIRELGNEAARRAHGLENPFARLDAVRELLFEQLGFRGGDVDDPKDSLFHEVLERKTGSPLALSVLFQRAASDAGFETRGIGLPGHYVCGVRYGGRDLLIDAYHQGAVIVEEDCRELVTRNTGRPSFFRRELLDGVDDRTTLGRMLGNLKRVYLSREDYRRALAMVELMLVVKPGDTQERRDRGILLSHLGQPDKALAELETYLELEPSAPDAASVRGRMAWLRRRLQ
ncbi:hypothetical protein ABI59_09155 [Acidobacteria bacterium Mor1]|nr:hypothetical protein ABI59_09155 [Acidobacteria bacterium Mor1]